jgi:hypothetical protein
MKGGMPDHDLKALGEVLEQGQAGLLVVYATNMADQVAANVKAVNKYDSQEIDARPTRSPGPQRWVVAPSSTTAVRTASRSLTSTTSLLLT